MTTPITAALNIGFLIFPNMDQCDFTNPFEVLSRLPNAVCHIAWKTVAPVADMKGLVFQPTVTLAACPPLDILVVPGGYGQQDLMDDAEVIAFIAKHSQAAKYVLGVCTGVLALGAAGVLKGKRATTHWTAHEVLQHLGATPVKARVVHDGKLVTAAGVTSGIDGALSVAALACGDTVAQEIQLYMEYDPQPPFASGSPEQAPAAVLATVRGRATAITEARVATGRRIGAALGLASR